MRGTRAAAAVLGAAALCLGPATATAVAGSDVTSFGFTASSTTVAPGGTVRRSATDCEEPPVAAGSAPLDGVTLREQRSGTAKVDPAAEPGAEYDVPFDCMGNEGMAGLTTADSSAAPTGTHTGTGSDTEHTAPGPHTGRSDPGSDTEHADTGAHTGHADPRSDTGHADPGMYSETRPHTDVRRGAKAGVGGSHTGIDPVPTAAGAALIAGAVGAGVHLMRRHRRG